MTPKPSGDGADYDAHDKSWTPAERALLEAALEFYGAAEGVLDLSGSERPRLLPDADGFDAVRRAMGALEECVLVAHAEGASPERIAGIARIEHEIVELILQRGPRAAPSPPGD